MECKIGGFSLTWGVLKGAPLFIFIMKKLIIVFLVLGLISCRPSVHCGEIVDMYRGATDGGFQYHIVVHDDSLNINVDLNSFQQEYANHKIGDNVCLTRYP